jgi:hypothetical protein
MTDRSDRDPPNLNGSMGLKPVGGMRSGSADFIGASGYAACKAGYRTATFLVYALLKIPCKREASI